MKHWNLDIISYWVTGAGCLIKKDLELSPSLPICLKHSWKLLPLLKVAPSSQSNNTDFFDRLVHHYYMERVAFSATIKHIFKTDLEKDSVSCVKDFISVRVQTLALTRKLSINFCFVCQETSHFIQIIIKSKK